VRRQRGHFAVVDQLLNVFSAHVFQINHRGRQITVAQPFLQRSNADSTLKTSSRVGVAEFVEEPSSAMRPFGALVAVFRDAMAAIEPGAIDDSFQLVLEFFIRLASTRGEYQIVRIRSRLPGSVFPQSLQQG
jgi:hypothetical protein